MRGPPPEPTAVRVLKGNPGRRKLNDAEPVTPPLSVTPPEWMEGDALAKQFWHELAKTVTAMTVGQESDRAALEMLSMCLAEARRAYERLEEDGRTVFSIQGGEKVSPHFTIMSRMISQAMGIMKEFGMTPASRTRVRALATGQRESKLSRFLGGGK
ncbi:MAG: phage terminase small subunit P27 family [Gemmataceae bacterium]|nr:phage terminase small subunit P27 family [Gemmataceae bacterium]